MATLIEALQLVAAPAGRQSRVCRELALVAEQVRSSRAAPDAEKIELIDVSLARQGVLPAEVAFLIERIDELFDDWIATGTPLDERVLAQSRQWKLMRALAREALAKLGKPVFRVLPP